MSTIHDVAELAHVSIATVSRVINQHPSVSEETRLTVKQAIEQLVSKINKSVSTFVVNTDFPTINKRLTNMLISLSISFI